jgi:hypothetical protein
MLILGSANEFPIGGKAHERIDFLKIRMSWCNSGADGIVRIEEGTRSPPIQLTCKLSEEGGLFYRVCPENHMVFGRFIDKQ